MKSLILTLLAILSLISVSWCQVTNYDINLLPEISQDELMNTTYGIIAETLDYEVVEIDGKLYIFLKREQS